MIIPQLAQYSQSSAFSWPHEGHRIWVSVLKEARYQTLKGALRTPFLKNVQSQVAVTVFLTAA
jgi:hypothetical protein